MVLKYWPFVAIFCTGGNISPQGGPRIKIWYLDLFNLRLYTVIISSKVYWIIMSGLFKFIQKM